MNDLIISTEKQIEAIKQTFIDEAKYTTRYTLAKELKVSNDKVYSLASDEYKKDMKKSNATRSDEVVYAILNKKPIADIEELLAECQYSKSNVNNYLAWNTYRDVVDFKGVKEFLAHKTQALKALPNLKNITDLGYSNREARELLKDSKSSWSTTLLQGGTIELPQAKKSVQKSEEKPPIFEQNESVQKPTKTRLVSEHESEQKPTQTETKQPENISVCDKQPPKKKKPTYEELEATIVKLETENKRLGGLRDQRNKELRELKEAFTKDEMVHLDIALARLNEFWELYQLASRNWASRVRNRHEAKFKEKYSFIDNALNGANPFKALGLGDHATLEEVKGAYKKLAKLYHPDKVKGKEEDFHIITEAYNKIKEIL